MDKVKLSWLIYCSIMGIVIGFGISKIIYDHDHPVHESLDLESLFTPSEYSEDYGVDLKQNGYLVRDEDGDVYHVPIDSLEEWFLNENI